MTTATENIRPNAQTRPRQVDTNTNRQTYQRTYRSNEYRLQAIAEILDYGRIACDDLDTEVAKWSECLASIPDNRLLECFAQAKKFHGLIGYDEYPLELAEMQLAYQAIREKENLRKAA